VNTFAIITIYSCMMGIICVFVGDRIINYFQLEHKFPRAAKYFKLRQNYNYTILFEILNISDDNHDIII
jgi:hypothetical protein